MKGEKTANLGWQIAKNAFGPFLRFNVMRQKISQTEIGDEGVFFATHSHTQWFYLPMGIVDSILLLNMMTFRCLPYVWTTFRQNNFIEIVQWLYENLFNAIIMKQRNSSKSFRFKLAPCPCTMHGNRRKKARKPIFIGPKIKLIIWHISHIEIYKTKVILSPIDSQCHMVVTDYNEHCFFTFDSCVHAMCIGLTMYYVKYFKLFLSGSPSLCQCACLCA